MCGGTCEYVAEKDEPEKWNGDSSYEWVLDGDTGDGGLDIEKWRCPHPKQEKTDYCVFHTDPEDLPEDVDESDEILEALEEAGESPFDDGSEHRGQFVGATFGAIDLPEERIAAREHDIRFDHAKFYDDSEDLDFDGISFVSEGNKPVSFVRTTFIGRDNSCLNFRNTTFETGDGGGNVNFGGATFETDNGKIDFRDATFETGDGGGNVNFGGATFKTGEGQGHVNFRDATFETGEGEGDVYFRETTFETGDGEGNVYFGGATFETGDGEGYVFFGDSTFATGDGKGYVYFWDSTFETGDGEGDVNFGGTTFATGDGEGDVSFVLANFETGDGDGYVFFGDTTFETGDGDGNVSFGGTTFETGDGEGYVDFRDAKFETGDGESYVNFRDATFGTAENDRIGDQTKIRGEIPNVDRIIGFENVGFIGPVRFKNANVDATVTLTFSGAEFEEEFVYGPDTGIPTLRGCLDFSDVLFEEQPNFLGGRQSIGYDSTESLTGGLYDAVFVNSVDFSDTQFPEGVDFSDFKFPNDTNFDGAKLSGANFSRADLSGASFERATLNRTEFLGANLQGAHLYGALLGDARVNRKTKFWPEIPDMRYRDVISLSDNPLGGGFYRRFKTKIRRGRIPYCAEDPRYAELDIEDLPPAREPNLEKAAEVYATIEQVARDNSLPGLASEAFLGRKDVQHREYRKEGRLSMRLRSFVPNLVARYGESPWRVLGTGAIIVLVWGATYWAFNLIERQSGGADPTLIETIYFSSLTFTTLGYGDFRPRNTLGQVLAVSETAFGVILLAILVFVFGRRATR